MSETHQIIGNPQTGNSSLGDVSPALLSEIVGLDQTYSLKHILEKLVEASEILLLEKDYDGHGWEIISKCTDLAKEKIKLLSNEG